MLAAAGADLAGSGGSDGWKREANKGARACCGGWRKTGHGENTHPIDYVDVCFHIVELGERLDSVMYIVNNVREMD